MSHNLYRNPTANNLNMFCGKNKQLVSEINERKLELQQKNEYIKILENARYTSQKNNIKDYNQGPDLFSLIGVGFGKRLKLKK